MALNIKNEDAQRLGLELAGLTGESITVAVTTAIRERLVREGEEVIARRADKILALGRQISLAVNAGDFSIEDLYGESGLPVGSPARLNFGDCFAYALASQRHAPLLFKGDDFVHTDLAAAELPEA
jgi:uncharacterized protein with PIN domain